MKEEVFIISLGGSILYPKEINTSFLKDFRNLILDQISLGNKFIIITGGGGVCRNYLEAVKSITTVEEKDLDWLGIASTRLNAEMMRVLFGDLAYEKVILDPDIIPKTDKNIILGGGWKPGNSSDLASIHSAISVGAKKVINLTNIDYVYTKDPKKYPDAEIIKEINWQDFREILPKEWEPGLNSPFDPIAAQKAEENNLEVIIMNGLNLENLKNYFENKEFIGTVIK